MNDKANPSHYTLVTVSPIELIEAYGLNFCAGNVVKYVARHQQKDGHDDLRKALWYLMREIGFPKERVEEITKEAQAYKGARDVLR